MFSLLFICFSLAVSAYAGTITVHNSAELTNALSHVKPGDTIQLADGEYHGVFKAHVSGSSDHPIRLSGTKKAQLSSSSYGLHLERVSYWTLKGFTIHNSKKGLVLDHSSHNNIDDLEV